MAAANDRDTIRIDPGRTIPGGTSAPGSDLEARALSAVERGVAQGITAAGELLAKPSEAAAGAPRADNRALVIATAALVLVGGQWLWSGRAHTERMDRLESRVDNIENGLGDLNTKIANIERGQLRLTYATTAIAAKVGAIIPSE